MNTIRLIRWSWTLTLSILVTILSVAEGQRCLICGPEKEGGACQPNQLMDIPSNITINDRMCSSIEDSDYHTDVLCTEFQAPMGYYFECADQTNSQFSCRSTCGPSIASIGTGPEFDLLNQGGGLLLGKEANKGGLFDFSNFKNGGALDFGLSGIGKNAFAQNGGGNYKGGASSQTGNPRFQNNNKMASGSSASSSASGKSDGNQFSSNIFDQNLFGNQGLNNNVFTNNNKVNNNNNHNNIDNNKFNTNNNNNNNNNNNRLGLNGNNSPPNIFKLQNPFGNRNSDQGSPALFKNPFTGTNTFGVPPTAPDPNRRPLGRGNLGDNNVRRPPTPFNSDPFISNKRPLSPKSSAHGKRDTDDVYPGVGKVDGKQGPEANGLPTPSGQTGSNSERPGYVPNFQFEVSPSNLVIAEDDSEVNLKDSKDIGNQVPVNGIAVGEPYPGVDPPYLEDPKTYPPRGSNNGNQGPVNGIAVGEPYPGGDSPYPDDPKTYPPTSKFNDNGDQGPLNSIAVGEPYSGIDSPYPDDLKDSPPKELNTGQPGPVTGIAVGEPYPGVDSPYPNDPNAYPPKEINTSQTGPVTGIAVGEPYPGVDSPYPNDPNAYPPKELNTGQPGPVTGIAVGEPYPGVDSPYPNDPNAYPQKDRNTNEQGAINGVAVGEPYPGVDLPYPNDPRAYPSKQFPKDLQGVPESGPFAPEKPSFDDNRPPSSNNLYLPENAQPNPKISRNQNDPPKYYPPTSYSENEYGSNDRDEFGSGPDTNDKHSSSNDPYRTDPSDQRGAAQGDDKMADNRSGLGGLNEKGIKPLTGLDGSRLKGDRREKNVDFDGTSLLTDSDYLDRPKNDRSRSNVPEEFEKPFQAENNIFPGFSDFANGNPAAAAFGTGQSVFNLFKGKDDSSPPGFQNGEFNFNNKDFLKPDTYGRSNPQSGNPNPKDGNPPSQTTQSKTPSSPVFPLDQNSKSFFPNSQPASPAIPKGNPRPAPGTQRFGSNPSYNRQPGLSNSQPPPKSTGPYNAGSFLNQPPYGQNPRTGPNNPIYQPAPPPQYGSSPAARPANGYGQNNGPNYQHNQGRNFQPFPSNRNPMNYIPPDRQQRFQGPNKGNRGTPQYAPSPSGVGQPPYGYRPGNDNPTSGQGYPAYGSPNGFQPSASYGPQGPTYKNGPGPSQSTTNYQYPHQNNNNNNYNQYPNTFSPNPQRVGGEPASPNSYYADNRQNSPPAYPPRRNNIGFPSRGPNPAIPGYSGSEPGYPPTPSRRDPNPPGSRDAFLSSPRDIPNTNYGYPNIYQRASVPADRSYPNDRSVVSPPGRDNLYRYGPPASNANRPGNAGSRGGNNFNGRSNKQDSATPLVLDLKPLNSGPYRDSGPAYGSPQPSTPERGYNNPYDQPTPDNYPSPSGHSGRDSLPSPSSPTQGLGFNQPASDDSGSYDRPVRPQRQAGRDAPDIGKSRYTPEALLDASPFSFEDPVGSRGQSRSNSRDAPRGEGQGRVPGGGGSYVPAQPAIASPANQNSLASPGNQYPPQADGGAFDRRKPGDFGFDGSFGSFGDGEFEEGFNSGGFTDPEGYFGDAAFTDDTTTEDTQESSSSGGSQKDLATKDDGTRQK